MVMRWPPLHSLRTFEAVARLGSVTSAAEDLCITLSAVSHQLSKLEEWLEIRLVERDGRGIKLTDAGEQYRIVVCDAFARVAVETSRLRRSKTEEGIAVSSLPMFSVSWLMPRLHEFDANHPNIKVTLQYSRGTQGIDAASTDLAIRFGQPEDFPDFVANRLLDGSAAPVCSPAYLERHPIRELSDIAKATLLHDEDRSSWRSWLKKAGLDPAAADLGVVMSDGNLTLANVMAGEGIGLLRCSIIQRQLQSHSLVFLSQIKIEEDLSYLLLTPRSKAARRNVLMFKDWLMARAAKSR